MTHASPEAPGRAPWRAPLRTVGACLAAAWLASCGGGGNPLGNPTTISNPAGASGQRLS